MPSHRSLRSLVFAALKRAGEDNRLDVAEHLLRALETLDAEPAQPSSRHPHLRLIPGGSERSH